MMWAKDYPLGTVIRHKYKVYTWLVNIEVEGVKYWEEQKWGDLFTVVDSDLFEIEVMI